MNEEQRLQYLEWLCDVLANHDGIELITETAGATFTALLDLPGMLDAYLNAMAQEPEDSPTSILMRELREDQDISDTEDQRWAFFWALLQTPRIRTPS